VALTNAVKCANTEQRVLSFERCTDNLMCATLARLALLFASIPAIGDVEADALVIDPFDPDTTPALERRLSEELRSCTLPLLHPMMKLEGDLFVNIRIGADGTAQVINVHGGNQELREAVLERFGGKKVE
jgi:hypothetical protein